MKIKNPNDKKRGVKKKAYDIGVAIIGAQDRTSLKALLTWEAAKKRIRGDRSYPPTSAASSVRRRRRRRR
jgi:hypothetical protein